MANLGARTGRRGQIMLVTALVLGISFVALALILNSAIFTENLASRGDTTGADQVVTYGNNLEDGIGTVVAFETRNATTDDDHAAVFGRIGTGVAEADAITVRRHAKRGATSNVSIVDATNGSRIYQTDGSRNVTNASGHGDWTLANDVTGTRAFRIDVTGVSDPDPFVVSIDNASHEWELRIRDDGSEVELAVTDVGGTTRTCSSASSTVRVDVTGGTVDGAACDALAFDGVPAGPYDVTFENGSAITGTYSLVVDDDSIARAPIPPRFDDDGDPTVAPAVYDLVVEYHYRTADIVVANEFRVAPGEPDE